MPEVIIEYKLLHELAKPPVKTIDTDAGFDISSIEDKIIKPGTVETIDTGLAVAVPIGYHYTIDGRSSLSLKRIFPLRGIIDTGYNGHLVVIMVNTSPSDYHVCVGDRIAQIIIHKTYQCDLKMVECFSDEYSIRGSAGWGSTGR